jgi:hypothetical protein
MDNIQRVPVILDEAGTVSKALHVRLKVEDIKEGISPTTSRG